MRLFEVGRRYLGDAEHPTLSLVLAGERHGRGNGSPARPGASRPFDVKAEVSALLDAAGAPVANLQVFPDAGPTWHPGRSARLGLGPKTIVASFGELHPRLQKELDAPAGAVAAEIYLDAIPAPRSSGRARAAYAPPALQAITRDFAFIVPADLSADNLLRAIRGARQSGHHQRPAVRSLRRSRRAIARLRSHASTGREELHRRANRGNVATHCRCRRKARRAPQELGH